jgi:transcriptional repressor NrdR
MKCPYCQGASHVVDTREVASTIRRRRECGDCRQRFTTYERIAAANLKVVKTDERREDFNRDKLVYGIQAACAKRPISADTIDEIAAEIESQVYRLGKSEVPSSVIGELVMDQLRELDDVAYVRFASVYRHFTDLEVLAEEIERLRAVKEQAEMRKRQMVLEM